MIYGAHNGFSGITGLTMSHAAEEGECREACRSRRANSYRMRGMLAAKHRANGVELLIGRP